METKIIFASNYMVRHKMQTNIIFKVSAKEPTDSTFYNFR